MHTKAKNPTRAETVFALMRQANVKPSLITYNALASAHASTGDVDAVERTLNQATSQRLALDRYSYGALLQACTKASGGKVRQVRPPLCLLLRHLALALPPALVLRPVALA